MKKLLFILLTITLINIDITAQTSLKSVKIGELWIEYGIMKLEVGYVNISDSLLIRNSVYKSEEYPLKDTIDAVSFVADLQYLKQKSHLIKKSKATEFKQFALDVINKKQPIAQGCFLMEFSHDVFVYLGRKYPESDYFLYWDSVIYSVNKKRAESFYNRNCAISSKKLAEEIRKSDEGFQTLQKE